MPSIIEEPATISLICFGACALATAYHSVLYIYYRDRILLQYVLYLACMCLFIFIRSDVNNKVFGDAAADNISFIFNEAMQVIYFGMYIFFVAHAIEVPKNKRSFLYKGWVFVSIVLAIYAVVVIILHLNAIVLPFAFFLAMRIFIFTMSFILLWRCFSMKVSVFQQWILFGCIYFFICGLMSFISNMQPSGKILFYPLEWLLVGNFGEILFFSSAMGYRLKTVNDERQVAITQAAEEKAIAQELRYEKTKAIMQTRLEERNRIALELHDDLGSGLTKIAILSEVAKTQIGHADKAKSQLENISTSARELVDSLQDIIWILNQKNDSLDSLAAYIREYTVKFFETSETLVYFDHPEEIPHIKLTGEQRRNIFLVIKETLNNVAKHACCNKIMFHLNAADNSICFIIKDDGKGFDTRHIRAFGNGLQNMKNRMLQSGGLYEVTSQPGMGTTTTINIIV